MSDPVTRFEEGLARVTDAFGPAFAEAHDEHALRTANARFAGPQGELTVLMKSMRELPGDRRREFGQAANAVKQAVTEAFEQGLLRLAQLARDAEMSAPVLDPTLPGRGVRPGRLHAITRVRDELVDIFASLGFDVAEGPEVDLYDYNFDKLGFPPDHPATDMQDTFFVTREEDGAPATTLLRAHTSTVQVREMLRRKPPFAIVSPGAVYRRDDDATHSPMFFQIEGLMVDEDVSLSDLMGVLTLFVKRLLGDDVPVRFRPSYFPFVEPGGEVDVGCTLCRPWAEGGAERSAAWRCLRGIW